LSWGIPIYSPIDGKIRACWRHAEENPKMGVKHVDLKTEDNEDWRIPSAGNSLFIETAGGHIIKLTHLQKNSIPSTLCPKNGNEFNTEAGRARTASGDYRVGMYIEPADRPSIKKGQFVGYTGNTGNSGGPHLHLDRATADSPTSTGVREPLEFKRIWAQNWEKDREEKASFWYRFTGAEFEGYIPGNEPGPPRLGRPDLRCSQSVYVPYEPRCKYTMFHGSPFLRRTLNQNFISTRDTAVTFLDDETIFSANKNAKNKLILTSWRVQGITNIQSLDTEVAGGIKQLTVAKVSSSKALVVVKTMSNRLKLILYGVSNNGTISRLDDYLSNSIRGIQLTRIVGGDDKFATALIGNNGKLKIIIWDVNGDQIVREGSVNGSRFSKTRVAATKNFRGLVTASRTSSNKLVLNTFTVSNDGMSVQKRSQKNLFKIGSALSVVAIPSGVVTAYKKQNNKMGIESHDLSDTGIIGRRKGIDGAGTISEIKLLNPALAGSNVASVVRDGSGRLRIIGWTMENNGSVLRRDGSSRSTNAQYINAATITKSYNNQAARDLIVISSRGPLGSLFLSTWDTNLNP
ncbi:M23 family metallopeptidase, partial [Bacteriovoracaceae bacterium]|nr:M23 family metallopeptidase [Bacteriovoracaceae bacterium]